jgi:hypothetical protein
VGVRCGKIDLAATKTHRLAERAFSCHSEACFLPKNLSVDLTSIEERFFTSLRMTKEAVFPQLL